MKKSSRVATKHSIPRKLTAVKAKRPRDAISPRSRPGGANPGKERAPDSTIDVSREFPDAIYLDR